MRTLTLAALCALAASASAGTGFQNVSMNAPVTFAAGSANGADLSTLTDGVFFAPGTQWQTDTVWWNGTSTVVEIALSDVFEIGGAIVQADNNDTYVMSYRDMDTGVFQMLWEVVPVLGAGMRTRPNDDDNTAVFAFSQTVMTDTIRIQAVSGDNNYSLSEVQVFAIPAPATAMGVVGFGAFAMRRRR